MNAYRPHTLLLATLALWTVAFVAWTADALVEPVPFALERALRRLPLCVLGALLCFALGRLLRRLKGRTGWLVGAIGVAGVVVASVIYALANELALYVIRPRWGAAAWIHIPDVAMLVLWVFTAWVLLYFALDADAARRNREVRLAQAHAAAIDAQHKLLLQQINPHFLFNALNTVYALVLENDAARARSSLLALSAFLRSAMDGDAPTQVSLSQELASARHYLAIELVRFGERLQLVEAIPSMLLDRFVPSLILQPLVENCIKHGLARSRGMLTITLTAACADGELILTVEDDGHAPWRADGESRGIGLANVAQRLKLLYGEAGRLSAQPRADGGFIARIQWPDNHA